MTRFKRARIKDKLSRARMKKKSYRFNVWQRQIVVSSVHSIHTHWNGAARVTNNTDIAADFAEKAFMRDKVTWFLSIVKTLTLIWRYIFIF